MRFRFRSGLTALLPVLAVLIAVSPLDAAHKKADKPLCPNADLREAMAGITPNSLRSDLSFLSSDALAGRSTPSPGLEAAAEFIASRFRADGLEAPVNGTYFQTADLTPYLKANAERHHKKLEGSVVGRNVIGILRGSDPVLRNTYLIVSAHYDHIGTLETAKGLTREKPTADGDQIYNGADDDGSGTVSVIALAEAFSRLKERPKRSILFVAFCGEELGLLGSRFYADHPVVPLRQTVANINLEQVGRTDGDIKKGRASLTGFDYTSLGTLFERAGKVFGLDVYKDENSGRYFPASDNYNFARYGIPDNTICTAFEFPDYHGLKDEWPKIDYSSMATLDKTVAIVMWEVADDTAVPHWNEKIVQTEKFRKAAMQTYGTESVP
jgi:Zn-dependent M28 family amino/carboxypeptidase